MTQPLPRGVAVALVTLFAEDGSVDVEATAEHAARLVGAGIDGVLVAGSTGEADTLTDAERVALIGAVRRRCPQVPLLAGASAAWPAAAAERARAAVAAGADAVLVAPPRRCHDLLGFYTAVAKAVPDGAVLAYHYPGQAGGAVPVPELASLPIGGIKDSTGDAERLLAQLEWGGATYVGSTVLTGYAGQLGAAGAILAVANLAPEECLAAFAGDAAAQRRLLATHLAVRERFPHGLKELLARRYGTALTSRSC